MKTHPSKNPDPEMDPNTLFYYNRFEAFRVNHPNAMAMTLCPQRSKFLIPWRQHFQYGYTYHKILQKSCHFMFIPEFRETDNSIHYHGMIQPFNKLAFKSRTFFSLDRIGFFKFKKNLDKKWCVYCVKDTRSTQPLINSFFLNCGPYMYYNNVKPLWDMSDEKEIFDDLAEKCQDGIKAEAIAIKRDSTNVKKYVNFEHIFRK